jgi:acetylornithine deacetylase/succinyl-diaminopimelate desuccinylase-like protein
LSGFPGGSDGATLQHRAGIPSVPAFGPGLLPLAHNPNEHISVEAIIQAAKVYALMAFYYCSNFE